MPPRPFSFSLLVAYLVVWLPLPLVPAAATPGPLAASAPSAPAWIEWDAATDRVVSEADDLDAAYPRAKQLSNREILLAYHHGDAAGAFGATVTLRKSRDGGVTWYSTQDVEVPAAGRFWGFSNPDFVELDDMGHLLLVSAARGKALPDAEEIFVSECARSGLRLRFSADFGTTWGKGRFIAAGRGRVWEPSLVRLSDGTLEIYYANEAPDLATDHGLAQRIELIRSDDDGQTWSDPIEISQVSDCRNGMPAALALSDGRVACAQEVVGEQTSPWISSTLAGQPQEYYLAQSEHGFGSSPFLARAPGGGTLLTYPSRKGKTPPPEEVPMSWMFQRVHVQHGDEDARNFGAASLPWTHLGARTGAFFPSLMVKDDGTVVALASFITLQPDHTSRTVVRWIEGRCQPTAPSEQESGVKGPALAEK